MRLDRPAALVVAHPGHELRVLGWLRLARPLVFVLTDGSGATNRSRVPSTEGVLAEAGACPGSIFGRLTDREMYARLMRSDVASFIQLTEELAAGLIDHGTEYIVGDASEGYNPTHDVCRLIINAAAVRVRAVTGREILNYDFTLVDRSDECSEEPQAHTMRIHLDDAMLSRKIKIAREYPEMAVEVETALAKSGIEAFRTECLRPVMPATPADPESAPFYETYGEQRVRSGVYAETLRYADHVRPVALALYEWATAGVGLCPTGR
jgi:hypothetical protein